jgi:hypothetical protein
MEIVRIPKAANGSNVAKLVITGGYDGRVRAALTIGNPMSSSSECQDYETVEQAEAFAISAAQQRRAAVLVIEDRT